LNPSLSAKGGVRHPKESTKKRLRPKAKSILELSV
jgi:hypothetical protein